jgi:hypothetical protein
MKPPTVEAVAVAAEIRGHHHAPVALNRGIPQLFVTGSVVSEAFFRPLANLNRAVKVIANKPVSLLVIDFMHLRF